MVERAPRVTDIEIVKVWEVRCEICPTTPLIDAALSYADAIHSRREHFFNEHKSGVSE